MLEADLVKDVGLNNKLGHLAWEPLNTPSVYNGSYIGCNYKTNCFTICITGRRQKDGRFKFRAYSMVKIFGRKYERWVEIFNTGNAVYNLDLVYKKIDEFVRNDLADLGNEIKKL